MKSLLEASPLDFLGQLSNVINMFDNKQDKTKVPYLNGSISNYSKNLIMTFPMMCDNSLRPSTASMISRANERNIVTMLELLFSSAQFRGNTGAEILKKIHTNINSSMGIDDYIGIMNDFSYKASNLANNVRENAEIVRSENEMVKTLKTPQNSFPVNNFSERSLNDYSVFTLGINNKTVVTEKLFGFGKKDFDSLDPNNPHDQARMDWMKNVAGMKKDKNAEKFAKNRDKREQEKHDLEMQRNKMQMYDDHNSNLRRAELDRIQMAKNNIDILSHQLLDSEVKKANEMSPTLMIVRFNELDTDGKIYGQRSFVAGVKSRLISVDAADIIDRISSKNKTELTFLNFIRATTGEISLMKDFLLCVDQAKIDSKNGVKKGEAAKMWKVLENRSRSNTLNKLRRKGNDASAITTLVINQETVNFIKKEFEFDIEKINNARSILETFNLLGIIIADESIEVVKFLYAGNDTFEQQAYGYLEKESNDNSYKKVINLMGKMNGR